MTKDYNKLHAYMEQLNLFEQQHIVRRGGFEMSHVLLHSVVGEFLTTVEVDCGIVQGSKEGSSIFMTVTVDTVRTKIASTWFDNVDAMPPVSELRHGLLRAILSFYEGLLKGREELATMIKTNSDDANRIRLIVEELKSTYERSSPI
jgi:hypothetical protein